MTFGKKKRAPAAAVAPKKPASVAQPTHKKSPRVMPFAGAAGLASAAPEADCGLGCGAFCGAGFGVGSVIGLGRSYHSVVFSVKQASFAADDSDDAAGDARARVADGLAEVVELLVQHDRAP